MLTVHWIKEFLYNELKELLLQSTFVNTLLPVKLDTELFPEVNRVQFGDGLKLQGLGDTTDSKHNAADLSHNTCNANIHVPNYYGRKANDEHRLQCINITEQICMKQLR